MSKKLLEQIIRIFDENGLEDADQEDWASVLKAKLEESGYEVVSIEVEEEHRGYDLDVMEPSNGHKKKRIGYDFLVSVEFRKLLSLYRQLALLHAIPYVVQDNQGQDEVRRSQGLFPVPHGRGQERHHDPEV